MQIEKWNNKICQCECKSYHNCKRDYSWNPSTYICENSKYNILVTECDEIITVVDILSIKKTNTIATNVTSTPLINCHSKIVGYCYILHTVLLVIILLLITTII